MSQPLPTTYQFKLDAGLMLMVTGLGGIFILLALAPQFTFDLGPVYRWIAGVTGAVCIAIPAYCVLANAGVSLDMDGFERRDMRGRKRYRWAEVSEFRVIEIRIRGGVSRAVGFNVADPSRLEAFNGALVSNHEAIGQLLIGDTWFACALMNAFRARALGLPQPQA